MLSMLPPPPPPEKACFLTLRGRPAPNPYECVHSTDVDALNRRLRKPLRFYSKKFGRVFEVPIGTVSDGRSVPWWTGVGYLLYGGRNSPAAWLHDDAYKRGILSRADADTLFREALIAEGERPSAAAVMYAAVRSFGWWPHGRYRRDERRAALEHEADDQPPIDSSPGG